MRPIRVPPGDLAGLIGALPGQGARVLLVGPMGSGKSTLAAAIAQAARAPVFGMTADPGSPAFGPPGAVSLGQWHHREGWQCTHWLPLCSLDAVRFRLPLVEAAGRLARRVKGQTLLVDAPGVVRGVAAAELVKGLAEAAGVDAVIVIDPAQAEDLADDLRSLSCLQLHVPADPAARRPARRQRERTRTAAWDTHLAGARRHVLDLTRLSVVGTPPPRAVPLSWRGRQVALLRGRDPRAMGEVVDLAGDTLILSLTTDPAEADTLLVRDACRNEAGGLVTAARRGGRQIAAERAPPPRSGQEPVSLGAGGITVQLPNGVLGDPLVAIRVPNIRGLVLFDLGDAASLSVRELHAVAHVFVSHGHVDHIGGFMSLLRARLSGDPAPCRIYGPPGMAAHVSGFIAGVQWDRIGETGPAFVVGEVSQTTCRWTRLQPGRPPQALGTESLNPGQLLVAPGFRVRCATLDHGIPVLAFALELPDALHVREAAVQAHGWRPGPWLGTLKRHLIRGERQALVALPDGSSERADVLGDRLLQVTPGTRIAYATDLADTPSNRHRLTQLAAGADLLICEAAFLEEDLAQARATGHLTAGACVEIARAAAVQRLLPFHFSRRYSRRLSDVYEELRRACGGSRLSGELVVGW